MRGGGDAAPVSSALMSMVAMAARLCGDRFCGCEREVDELDDLVGVGAALAADPGDEGARVIDEAALDAELLLGDQRP